MKAWHVTCTCAIWLLFPLDYVPCLSDQIGWVESIPFFPCRVFLWGWIRPICIDLGMVVVPFCLCGQLGPGWICFWVINLEDLNCLQRDPCVGRWFSWHLSQEGFLPKHLERYVRLVFRQRDKWTCLLLTRLGFYPWGLHRPTGGKDTIACSKWRIISRGFFSEWDMVMAKGLVQWHLILSRGRRW